MLNEKKVKIMKLKIIGTSCTWFERLNTSYVIDNDIIFDVPNGNYKPIIKYTDISKLRCIIISHFHTDHFADFRIIATLIMRHFEKYGRTAPLKRNKRKFLCHSNIQAKRKGLKKPKCAPVSAVF